MSLGVRRRRASAVDNETWIIEAGDRVIQKKARSGFDSLSDWERLVYSLWVADYGMRNAGDLDAAKDWFPEFQAVGLHMAERLDLHVTRKAFALVPQTFAERYIRLFESVCDEVQNAEPDAAAEDGA